MSNRTAEHDLLAAIRASPGDVGPRLVYADWLTSRDDERGELITLDEHERSGAPLTREQLDRLLRLAATHGFPKLPDDPCADILRWTGGGSFPVQYDLEHAGHRYYLRWRSYDFSIEVDDSLVFEGTLDTRSGDEWTILETNVILAIVSRAIQSGAPLSELLFPDQAGMRAHPMSFPGRCPQFVFPEDFDGREGLGLEPRDFTRWHQLWEHRQRMVGIAPTAISNRPECGCGVVGLSCYVPGCDRRFSDQDGEPQSGRPRKRRWWQRLFSR